MLFPILTQAPTGTTTLRVKIREHASGDWLDFADGTFKSAGHVAPFLALVEADTVEFPGLFQASADVDPSLWSDGVYVAHITDTDELESFNPIELQVRDGRLSDPGALMVCGIVGLTSATGDVEFSAWLMNGGEIYSAPDSLSVSVFTAAGALVFGPLVDASPDANGVFRVVEPAAGLVVDTTYYAIASITADGVTYKAPVAFVVY